VKGGEGLQPDAEVVTYEGLADLLVADYVANRRRSIRRAQGALAHLREVFQGMPAVEITEVRLARYVHDRQAAGAANATINRELSILKRAFRLALRFQRVVRCPYVPLLSEDNVRTGFFEREEYLAVLRELPARLQPVVAVAYVTGWRTQSEILTRRWRHVDLEAGWLRIDPSEGKDRGGRTFPLIPVLRRVVETQRRRVDALAHGLRHTVEWLLPRDDGRPIRSFHRAWVSACRRAGVAGRIPHDFRRTAVRNLERAGVARSTAMALVGHRTESIYRRYAIADERSLHEAGTKLEVLLGANWRASMRSRSAAHPPSPVRVASRLTRRSGALESDRWTEPA